MKNIFNYKFPLILVIVLYIFHLTVRDFSSPYDKPINADAKSYYAYLPAIFIYHDSQYHFVNDNEQKYYAEGFQKDFLNETPEGKKVNKTFPGAALLYLPFFLLAHFLALIFGLEADGYSLIYQYLFDFGYWFYLGIGAIYYVKLFRHLKFKDKHINLSLFLLIVGTNIFFYSVIDDTVTHIMNFALINAVIYHCLKLNDSFNQHPLPASIRKRILYIIALLVLIGITRPTNILVFLAILIFIPNKTFYIRFFKALLNLKTALLVFVIVLLVGSIPFLLWQWQTQHWVVYSYGDEGFDFSNPQIFNFLWSYKKGWFVFTPIAFISIVLGLFYVFKSSVKQGIYIVLFYTLSIFIFSSWWCWYYGAGLSQRVMIDYYSILGYLMLMVLSKSTKPIKIIFVSLSFLFVIYNLILTYQIKNGIYRLGVPTKEIFWDNFLSLKQKMKVYEKSNWQLKTHLEIPLDEQHVIKGLVKKGHQNYFIQTNPSETYSPTVSIDIKQPFTKLILKFKALPQTHIEQLRLVVFNPLANDKLYTVYLKDYCYINSESTMEVLIEPQNIGFPKSTTSIHFYFWNGGTEEVCDFYDFEMLVY